jgi:hypothetical protein
VAFHLARIEVTPPKLPRAMDVSKGLNTGGISPCLVNTVQLKPSPALQVWFGKNQLVLSGLADGGFSMGVLVLIVKNMSLLPFLLAARLY